MFAPKNKLLKSSHLLLISIVIFAGFIRFYGSFPSFNQFHSDEGISYSAAVSMIRSENLDPLRYDYPALVPVLNLISFRTIFIPVYWVKYYITNFIKIIDGYVPLVPSSQDINRIFQNDILGEREINALFWGRYTTAFVSTLSVALIYILGTRLFNKQVGFLSAIILAVSFRAVSNSHIGLPDTYNAFFLLFSILVSFNILRYPSRASYLLAGVGLGLSFATKYQVFCFFPFIYSYLLSRPKLRSLNDVIDILKDVKLYLAIFSAALVFAIINPYFFIHYDVALQSIRDVSAKYAMGRNNINLFPLHYWIVNEHGLVLVIAMFGGLVLALFRKTRETLLLLSSIIPFIAIMMYYSVGGFYVRNFISISPLMFIFASYAIYSLCLYISKISKLPVILCIFLVLSVVLYLPIKNTIIHTQYYRLPWGYREIIGKARTVLKDGDIIVGHPFDPLPENIKVIRIPISVDSLYSLAEARNVNAHYVYINMDWAGDPFYGWMTSSFPENLNYVFGKPIKQMRDSYWGIAVEEMMHNVTVSSYKPWQASDAALFLVKVPTYEFKNGRLVKEFSFKSDEQGWQKKSLEDSDSSFLSYNSSKAALQIGPGQFKFGTVKYSSPEIEISGNKLYKIGGNLFADEKVSDTLKKVFLRVDFYETINGTALLSSVSERFFGENKYIEHFVKAPSNAHYMQVSFASSKILASPVYLKNIAVFEGPSQEDSSQINNINFSEYGDLLYPNSHGNL